MARFDKVLVANRGEIACRVIRTCRAMGLATVAVFSDADEGAPHVEMADEAVRLGPAPAAESYLNVQRILDAARKTGAGAIHPGYGFLAENAAFVRAVNEAGLVFIGPRAETVERMGSKAGARASMAAAGVPVVPGYDGADQADATLVAEAARIGFPLLVKASAGGGGKGMTIVRRAEDVADAVAQARRVAQGAFGDGRLLLERYIESPRHIEVQIFGDEQGNVIHLYERECSIQRRFQKVIEEAPSPALSPEQRERLCAAAVTAGRAIGYVGAGTVEFIFAPSGEFFFLEVNTRLQVEHPVTEAVTRLDLVELQVRVAQGEPLPIAQDEVETVGHAIEARLCAEDPGSGFLPATGRLVEWSTAFHRVDAGVARGSEIGVHYDSLLAKVIGWAGDRAGAIEKLSAGLRTLVTTGVTTNCAFLLDVLTHPEFRAGRFSTHFIAEQWPDGWRPRPPDPVVEARLAIAAALDEAERNRAANPHVPALRPGWRNNPFRPQRLDLRAGGREVRVEYESVADRRYRARVGDGEWLPAAIRRDGGILALELDGVRRTFRVRVDGDRRHVRHGEHAQSFEVVPRFPEHAGVIPGGGCLAPMPGKVVKLLVSEGQPVDAGAPLIIVEAMKMELTLTAPAAGVVVATKYRAGDLFQAGVALVELAAGD
jgi:acetyl/propionyl-CoA carboxylase alpha subunit